MGGCSEQEGVPEYYSAPQVLSPFQMNQPWNKSLGRVKSLGQNQNSQLVGQRHLEGGNLKPRSQSHPDSSNVCLMHPSGKPGTCTCKWSMCVLPSVAPLPEARALQGTGEGAGTMLLPMLANPGHRKQRPRGWS